MPGRMEEFGFFLSRTFATTKAKQSSWPFVPGTYFVADPGAPVAVATLGSVSLAEEISQSPPPGLCIVGKVETENIGIEKIIKNVISNSSIRFLICTGQEPPKHLTGATMIALFLNGVDENNRIIDSPGMRPMLPNTSPEEVEAFRRQVEPIDMIGCTDIESINEKITELAKTAPTKPVAESVLPMDIEERESVEHVIAEGTPRDRIKLDKAGYFVINIQDGTLLLEHYSYKEKLIRIIEGKDARSIYLTLIRNGWVSKLDHAAYLGKELTKAELSQQYNFDYLQDGG